MTPPTLAAPDVRLRRGGRRDRPGRRRIPAATADQPGRLVFLESSPAGRRRTNSGGSSPRRAKPIQEFRLSPAAWSPAPVNALQGLERAGMLG